MKKMLLLAGCLVLGVIGAATYSWFSQPKAKTAPATAFASREYYLTKGTFAGNQAAQSACISGYHMASIFEVYDTAALQYDTTNGSASDDSSFGPPAASREGEAAGWIRTGQESWGGLDASGANCSAWTSASPAQYGSAAYLRPIPPSNANPTPAAVAWVFLNEAGTYPTHGPPCSLKLPVWCVQD